MHRRSLAALGLASVLLLGAAPLPIPTWVLQADLEVSIDVSPRGQIDTCVGQWERFLISDRVVAYSLLGLRRFDLGARPADLNVSVDGHIVAAPHTTYFVLPQRFRTVGRHTVRIEPSDLDWGVGAGSVNYVPSTVTVNVIECHYLVETRGVIHMNDGGFQPVLGGSVDSTKLTWDATAAEFTGTGTETNVAVAFPNNGCKATFKVEPSAAHFRGTLTPDGLTFHLDVNWDRGSARLEAQGVECGPLAGGRTNSFTIKPYSGDLSPFGVTTANAPLQAWTIDTGGHLYTGFIYVTLTKVRGP